MKKENLRLFKQVFYDEGLLEILSDLVRLYGSKVEADPHILRALNYVWQTTNAYEREKKHE